ncbi:MAG: recombinase family protein [Actinomycetota bacterium]|nr:recombinase family protein [Actinomycetota bacterium]
MAAEQAVKIGYARVSTADQDPAMQLHELEAAGAERVYVENASGARADRPQLAACLEQLTAGDSLIIWRLDRLGRSLKDLVRIVDELKEAGVQLCSLRDGIDTSTAGGRLQFGIFASLAEFERALISERTKAGLDAARRRGSTGGRPKALSDQQLAAALALKAQGISVREAASLVGVSKTVLYEALRAGSEALS